jgi:hypothetical protein
MHHESASRAPDLRRMSTSKVEVEGKRAWFAGDVKRFADCLTELDHRSRRKAASAATRLRALAAQAGASQHQNDEDASATDAPPSTSSGHTLSAAWAVFDMAPTENEELIKRRFRELALRYHPDRGGSNESFRRLVAAYEDLMRWLRTRP